MDIPNVGQAMGLGDLYNVRTGHCTNVSVLSKPLTSAVIESRDENAISSKFISEDTYKEKFKAYEIEGNLKLSILANIVSLNAQAKYLTAEKKSSTSVKVSMSYAVQTKYEKINIRSDPIREYMNLRALDDPEATHVVTGIQWGANMFCSFEHSLEEGETKKEVEGILGACCNTLKVDVGFGGELAKKSKQSNKELSIQISIHGDVVPSAASYPTSVEDAVQLMRQVPEFVKGVNQGKGSVLRYRLEPIDKVRAHFELETRLESVINTIRSDLVDQVESTFDTIVENRIRLTESSNDILGHSQYVAEAEVKRIKVMLKNFNRDEREFKRFLSETTQDIQARSASADALSLLLDEFEEGNCSSSMVDQAIESYKPLMRRIAFIRRCNKINIQVIPRGNEISDVLSTSVTDTTCILVIPKSWDYTVVEQSHLWHIFRLLREDGNDAQTTFMIHDVSISSTNPQWNDLTELKIVRYHGSNQSDNKDVFRSSILRPTIKLSSPQPLTQEERTALTGHVLRMPCPLSLDGVCHSGTLKWVCFKCEEVLQYEYNELVYCNCGETRLKDCNFRCDCIKHGYQYQKLHAGSVASIHPKTNPGDDEINILLLGETGVGKSTFINAFANYLRYDSLEIAEQMEMTTLIQSSFDIAGQKVTVGKPDQNEKLQEGQSSTQFCRSYVFPLNDDIKIRLIDTPGVGDTRGVKQDRANFEEIMNYISGFEKINGVCILMLPNNSRITSSFQFCIDELLLHLHKTAADNILFTFTNSRSTFYGPGDTMAPLQKYVAELKGSKGGDSINIRLEPNTMFYFDNEAFRLYAALKNGISFDPETKEAYESSWIHSVVESRRLVKRIMDLKPHKTADSVTLDIARRSIYLLSPSMAKINENITVELGIAKNLKTQALSAEKTAKDLRAEMICSYVVYDPRQLASPRTVCTSASCTTINDRIVLYNQHCHTECYLRNIAINVKNHADLRYCSAMDEEGNCQVCGCRWERHMHITIDHNKVRRQKTNTAVEQQIYDKLSEVDKKNSLIAEADARIRTLESEKTIIFESLKTFTGFLLQNSILVQNNGALAYIDMSIDNQEKVALRTGDNSVVNSLKAQRAEFEAETVMFKRTISDGNPAAVKITPEQVISARNELFQLKINGEALAKNMHGIDDFGANDPSAKETTTIEEFRQQIAVCDHKNTCIDVLKHYSSCPVPGTFLVLPADLESWDDLDPTTHNFRIYFLCDATKVGMDDFDESSAPSDPHRSILPQHKHFSNHPGYDPVRPQEFFQTYGSYILMILNMVRQGFTCDTDEIPPLDNFKILWGVDLDGSGSYLTKDTIGILISKTINYLEGLSLPLRRSEIWLHERECVAIKDFLFVPSGSNALGGLYRCTNDPEKPYRHHSMFQSWTWTCKQNAHQWLTPGGHKALEDFVYGCGGHVDLQLATVTIELQSQQQAEMFCKLLKNTGQKFHVSIKLIWKVASRQGLDDLLQKIVDAQVQHLELDGVPPGIHLQQGVMDYRSDFFAKYIARSSMGLSSVTLHNYPGQQEQCTYVDDSGGTVFKIHSKHKQPAKTALWLENLRILVTDM
ncbi:hypothetical protein BG005_010798 [Podila minutissima]|nr:hypothetical protein BG005_010798 [Podila minutissima]